MSTITRKTIVVQALMVTGAGYTPIPARLVFDPNEAYLVTLAFGPKAKHKKNSLDWVVGRRMLFEGMFERQGEDGYDVKVFPWFEPGCPLRTCVELTSPGGRCLLLYSTVDLAAFLIMTHNDVPFDTEEHHILSQMPDTVPESWVLAD